MKVTKNILRHFYPHPLPFPPSIGNCSQSVCYKTPARMEAAVAGESKLLFTVLSAGDTRPKFVRAAGLAEVIEKGKEYLFK